jgi:hypothetical protein
MSVQPVNVAVYANFLAVVLLFALGRHAGGSPPAFPALYFAIAALVVTAAMSVSRPGRRSFAIAFLSLALAAALNFVLYILNERAMASGRVGENLLGYLFATTFSVAITALGFVARPEFQERCGIAEHRHLDPYRGQGEAR